MNLFASYIDCQNGGGHRTMLAVKHILMSNSSLELQLVALNASPWLFHMVGALVHIGSFGLCRRARRRRRHYNRGVRTVFLILTRFEGTSTDETYKLIKRIDL